LEAGGPSDNEFLPAELQFLFDLFALLNESLCALVFGLGLEPVGRSGDALYFLGVLFGFVVLLIDFDPLLNHVHVSYINNYRTKIDLFILKIN
jgi:hypothetical protein